MEGQWHKLSCSKHKFRTVSRCAPGRSFSASGELIGAETSQQLYYKSIQLSESKSWHPISRFNPVIFLLLSQSWNQNSNVIICQGIFMFSVQFCCGEMCFFALLILVNCLHFLLTTHVPSKIRQVQYPIVLFIFICYKLR